MTATTRGVAVAHHPEHNWAEFEPAPAEAHGFHRWLGTANGGAARGTGRGSDQSRTDQQREGHRHAAVDGYCDVDATHLAGRCRRHPRRRNPSAWRSAPTSRAQTNSGSKTKTRDCNRQAPPRGEGVRPIPCRPDGSRRRGQTAEGEPHRDDRAALIVAISDRELVGRLSHRAQAETERLLARGGHQPAPLVAHHDRQIIVIVLPGLNDHVALLVLTVGMSNHVRERFAQREPNSVAQLFARAPNRFAYSTTSQRTCRIAAASARTRTFNGSAPKRSQAASGSTNLNIPLDLH
jgi:hypothetical protein